MLLPTLLSLLFSILICSNTANAAFFVATKISPSPQFSFDQNSRGIAEKRLILNNQNHQKKEKWSSWVILGASSIKSGDTVLVIGGTGGVGQLVSKKLASGMYGQDLNVRVTSRNVQRGEDILDDSKINVVPLNLVAADSSVMEKQLEIALKDTSAVVISVGTTAFPTTKWIGGNTPDAIDNVAVTAIAKAAGKVDSIQKIILITSIGVDRTDTMPFKVLNLFGVLEAKKQGENAVKRCGKDYVIIRPGRLVGGPFTNLDIAKLLQVQGGPGNGVDMKNGDCLLGDCKREVCSDVVVQCLLSEECRNIDFSIVSNETKKAFVSSDEWNNEFQKLLYSTAASVATKR